MSEGSPIEKLKGFFHKSGKPDYEKEEVPSIFFAEFSKLPQKDREKRLRSMIGKDVQFFFDSKWVVGLLFRDDSFFMDGKEYINVTLSSNAQIIWEYYKRGETDIRDTFHVLFTQEQFQDLARTYWGLPDPRLDEERHDSKRLSIPIYSFLDLQVIKVSDGPKRFKGKPSFLFKGVTLPIEDSSRSAEEKLYGISRKAPSKVANVGYVPFSLLYDFVHEAKKKSGISRR